MDQRITPRIEKGIPAPVGAASRRAIFHDMEVGDSIFFAEGQSSVSRCATSFRTYHKLEWVFVTRGVTENGVKGTRIWRTA